MEGVVDTHGIRPMRKEEIVDWLIRVLYKLEYYDHGLLSYMYAGVVTLLEELRNMSDPMWDGTIPSTKYGWVAVGRSKTSEALRR